MVTFNPFDYAFHEDPYPVYEALRREAPIYHNPDLGFWAFARHEDVLEGFKNWELYTNTQGVALEQQGGPGGDVTAFMSMLGMDPPRHAKIRSLVSRGFTPRRVSELEPRIRELASHYLDRVVETGPCDFIAEFAGKLPMDVISEMLDVSVEDRDMLRGWADQVLHREEGVNELPQSAIQASAKLFAYYIDLVKERKQKPGEDLVSALLSAEVDGERLEDKDVIGFLFLMIIAGNETTTKLLANALYWADRNPGERDKLRVDAAKIPDWIEETLRYDNSSQLLGRTVTRDHEVRGHRLREGEKVLLLVGSANRDEEVWDQPTVYDIDRDTSQSLSFGRGTHFCLGASLARLEARVSLEELRARIPELSVVHDGLVRVHSTNVRGFAALPIDFQ